jgi:Uma2 family endonuclease
MDTAFETDFLKVEEYLSGEEDSPLKHEYVGGMVYAMAGTSDAHNTIALSFSTAFRAHVRGRPCRVFVSDLKVHLFVSNKEVFYYPDVMVTCDPRDPAPLFKEYPKVIVEVLSESTEGTDRREKFWNYIQIESLEEYVLAAQDKMEVTLFRRGNHWKPEVLRAAGEELELSSLKLTLSLSSIYEGVEL